MHFFDTLRSKLDADDHALTRLLKIYSKVTTQPLGKSTSQELLAIFSPSYSLDDMHKNIAERLRKRKKPLLVLVDDVDRLLPLEMLSLLRLIRNTADFPNMVYLVAADKVAMTEALYSQHIENPVLYLEKFFNYEFLFPANEERIKDALLLHLVICLGKYGFDEERQSNARYYMESYRYIKEVFKSPRDIKRYMNILSFSLDGMKANGIINDVYLPDLLAICLIQYLDESIYKILRDANETLLSFSTISEVYTLKTEYEEASRSRQEALDTLQWLKEKTDTKEQPKFEYKDLRQTLTEQSTSVNLIVAKLLYDLFNSHTGRGTHRISYALEYFKYFAGHYRSNELSNAQANAIWGMTIQEFDIYIIQTIASDSYASLMHKFDLFITTEGHNKLEMLQKLLFVYNRVADIEIKKIPRCDAYSYYSRYGEAQYKIMKLYSYEYAIPTSIADCENADLSEYFMRNNNFMNLAMTLLALRRIDKTRYSTSFTDEMRQTWEENIIRRFFNEVFVKEFLNHLETMPFIRELDPMEYKSCFLEIIAKSKNPLDWIFCCVGRKGTHYQWKENIMHSLFEDNINKFRESISLYMRPFMNATIAADFDELLSDNKMSKASLNDHPFLQAWEDWIAEKEIS